METSKTPSSTLNAPYLALSAPCTRDSHIELMASPSRRAVETYLKAELHDDEDGQHYALHNCRSCESSLFLALPGHVEEVLS